MYLKENDELTKIILLIREDEIVWEVLCGNSIRNIAVIDYIGMLEELVAKEFYQLAMILLFKLDNCYQLNKAITNVIVNRINNPNTDIGIITECIEEIKSIADKEDIKGKIFVC